MARVNLLPWRAERRKLREKQFYTMLGAAAAAAIGLSVFVWMYYNGQISGQNDRNAFMQAEIAKVDLQRKEIETLAKKKADLLSRKQVIEQLQANRYQMVHLFDALVRTVPEGLVLSSVKQEGDQLTLTGQAQSNARVATYMRNLESAGWMKNPDVNVIEAAKTDAAAPPVSTIDGSPRIVLPYTFTMRVTLANPNDPKDPNAPPTPDPVVTTAPAAPTTTVAPVAGAVTPAPAPTGAAAVTPAPASQPTATDAVPAQAKEGVK